jgi:hypothetical protein
MKWKNRKLFNVSHITLVGKTREEPFTSQVWASSEQEARDVWQGDADWTEVQSVEAAGKENWEPVSGPDLPPVRDGLLLLRMERDYEMVRFADGRSCTAWVRVSERSWQDYSGRSFEDTEITIAVPAAMTTSAELIDAAWSATITDWRKNYIEGRKVSGKIVGDAFIVTINWLMDLS